MKKIMKKTISIILTGAIILGVFGVTSFASNEIDYTIVNPYETVDWDTWGVYKANLHTHLPTVMAMYLFRKWLRLIMNRAMIFWL